MILNLNQISKISRLEEKNVLTINSFGYNNTIVLNAAELKIKNCTVEIANKTLKAQVKLDTKKEELQIKLLSQKIKGKAIIHFDYTGILNDRLLGILSKPIQRQR